jgi:hypothetical protein
VTGLEIEGTTIRLVRWPDRDNRPRKQVLAEAICGHRFSRSCRLELSVPTRFQVLTIQ